MKKQRIIRGIAFCILLITSIFMFELEFHLIDKTFGTLVDLHIIFGSHMSFVMNILIGLAVSTILIVMTAHISYISEKKQVESYFMKDMIFTVIRLNNILSGSQDYLQVLNEVDEIKRIHSEALSSSLRYNELPIRIKDSNEYALYCLTSKMIKAINEEGHHIRTIKTKEIEIKKLRDKISYYKGDSNTINELSLIENELPNLHDIYFNCLKQRMVHFELEVKELSIACKLGVVLEIVS